jgi:hypothetical protein
VRRRSLLAVAAGLLAGCAGTSPGTDDDPTATPSPGPTPAADPFAVRVALVRRYQPGTNRGMPTVVTDAQVNRTLAANETLTDRLRAEFAPDDRFALYRRVLQYRRVAVTRRDDGWAFRVTDDDSCTVREIRGVYADGAVRNVTTRTESVPC